MFLTVHPPATTMDALIQLRVAQLQAEVETQAAKIKEEYLVRRIAEVQADAERKVQEVAQKLEENIQSRALELVCSRMFNITPSLSLPSPVVIESQVNTAHVLSKLKQKEGVASEWVACLLCNYKGTRKSMYAHAAVHNLTFHRKRGIDYFRDKEPSSKTPLTDVSVETSDNDSREDITSLSKRRREADSAHR